MNNEIKAFVFDVYGTLFDVHSVKKKGDELYEGKGEELSKVWRQKQLEYSFLRQIMGSYESFLTITRDSLRYALHSLELKDVKVHEDALIAEYTKLSHYPETEKVLSQLNHKKLAIFSNGSHDMLDPLIKQSGLSPFFDHVISVDEGKQYKPSPASYTLVLKELGVKREEVLFMSSNGWDISGAKNFGFRAAWINRGGLPEEELGLSPDSIYSDLNGILEWK
ncbi:haloacid dehalogenase type II [Metabacillus idriensis]|uniref:Haloacid dehalogenase type II n=1 Tax=Metabacillus idriensis TaxID=324768 RepID=A0A6I2MF79_9BACI|nr:haloacid dehalogenase type II [Metabacillus idriensis]MCM3598605.1 haloacid dehalogenase type II [Metabacillus idriensis]MRX54443.1 haloacid dehalogenase type II [Metabacillus idriensis]OHR63542.1 haloacid dehalogenase [Bacillus sp. HMSC76G11]